MRAILVCVDFADLLAVTLPYNRHHFDEVWVVTTHTDLETHQIAEECEAEWYPTTAFYAKGAAFNKFAALEEGLDRMGREGWLAIIDVDVLWPKHLAWKETDDWLEVAGQRIQPGALWTPKRRMAPWPGVIPAEEKWSEYWLHPQQQEWAGYTQIFHASDPALGRAPWHQTNWKHAGGADSFFQAKWPQARKERPPFEVLHLGESGMNWCGRVAPYADGTRPEKAIERYAQLRQFVHGRRHLLATDAYAGEKF